jgi:hypothetical protein
MSDDLITLWRYRDLPEALIAHSKLDAEGFDCFLADDNIVRLNWFWSNGFGGVRLRVRAEDSESALEVLAQEIPAGFTAEEVGEEYQQPACPKCGSLNISFETMNRGIALAALWVFAFPVPIPRKSWKCLDCRNRWRAPWI